MTCSIRVVASRPWEDLMGPALRLAGRTPNSIHGGMMVRVRRADSTDSSEVVSKANSGDNLRFRAERSFCPAVT